jgi:ADP-ribosylglycohydrolase
MRVTRDEKAQLIEGQTSDEIGMIRYLIKALTDKKLNLKNIQQEMRNWYDSTGPKNLSQIVTNAIVENKNHESDTTAYLKALSVKNGQ